MKDAETVLWGIHAGKTGDADTLFLKRNRIAIGWVKMGDLGALKADREAFKSRVAEVYPEKKPGAIPNNAGQLFRFVHEMKSGDIAIYPSKRDRQVHLGRVEGNYTYDPRIEPGYPNLRAINWLRSVPRTQFSQGALYEIGSALSLFLVRNYADEFRAALEGKATPPTPVGQDESVAAVAEGIEDTTRDFVLKRLSQELKGTPLEDFVAHLLEKMGYRARLTRVNEPSVDIIAHKDALGFEPPIIKVQVKSGDGKISDKDVSALLGKLGSNEFGLIVTLGEFTSQAITFAASKSNLRLVDGDELVNMIYEHYDQFDSRYKGLLPLRRVYVPEVIESDEE